jgi:hypothetical protein
MVNKRNGTKLGTEHEEGLFTFKNSNVQSTPCQNMHACLILQLQLQQMSINGDAHTTGEPKHMLRMHAQMLGWQSAAQQLQLQQMSTDAYAQTT